MARNLLRVSVAILIVLCAALVIANWPESRLANDATADRVIVEKAKRTLTLYRHGVALKTYSISLGGVPSGAKQREGDNRTPEGSYVVDAHNPNSSYHLALHVSYPNAVDRARAAALGVAPGGDIMIHGLPNHLGWLGRIQRLRDWTAGCMAATDPEIDEIYRAVPDGTPVEIRP